MPRYSFVSPGAAAGEGIVEILARRREEERQKLLDEITAKDSESRRAAQAAQIEEAKTRQELAMLDAASQGWARGEDLEESPLYGLAVKHGRVGPKAEAPTPSVSTSADFAVEGAPMVAGETPTEFQSIQAAEQKVPARKKSSYFRGTQADIDRERKSQKAAEIMAALSDPKLSRVQRLGLLVEAEAAGIDVASGAWPALARPEGRRVAYDPVTNTTTPITVGGEPVSTEDEIINRGRPPRPLQAQNPNYLATDPDTGEMVFGSPEGPFVVKGGKRVPFEGKVAPKPSTTPPKVQVIPPNMRINLNTLRKNAGSGRPRDIEALQQGILNVISDAQQRGIASPDVADTVREILYNQARDPRTLAEIIADHANIFSTADEFNAFQDLLSTLWTESK